MRIACYGSEIPQELTRVIKNCPDSSLVKTGQVFDAVVLTGGASKAKVSLKSNIPVFYCHTGANSPALQSLFVGAVDSAAPFYVPYRRRLSPVYATLRGEVDAGKVGKVGFIKIHSNLVTPKAYRAGKAGSCATLVSREMIHDIDWLHGQFGPIRSVFCQGIQRTKPTTEYAMATFTLKGGVIAQVIHSYQSKVAPSLRVEICGNDGIVQYDSDETPIRQSSRPASSDYALDRTTDEWSQHWTSFQELVAKGKATKKVTKGFIDPIRIADLSVQSILSGSVKKV